MNKGRLSVLVTGANGFVGRVVCEQLFARGHAVRGAARSQHEIPGGSFVQIATIDENTDWSEALKGEVDVVIHLAARVHVMHDKSTNPLAEFRKVNTAGTERLARAAAKSGVRRFVYVSSIKVNGEATVGSERFTEQDVPKPQDPYAVSKWEAEQVLHRIAKETGIEVVVVRPPLVYGQGVKGNFAQMLKVLSKGIPLPLSAVSNSRSLVYVENLADALIVCAIHPAATGQTYLVSDGEDISTPDLLRSLANAMGVQTRLFYFPPSWLLFLAKMLGKAAPLERLTGSLKINSDKIRNQLGWFQPFTLPAGLKKTVRNVHG